MAWKKTLLPALLVLAPLAANATTLNTDLVVNGTFADMTGWTKEPGAATTLPAASTGSCNGAVVTAPGTEAVTSTAGFAATDGTTALLGSTENTSTGAYTCTIYQDIAVPVGATTGNLTLDVGLKVVGGKTVTDTLIRYGVYDTSAVPNFLTTSPLTNGRGQVSQTGTTTLTPQTLNNINLASRAGQTVRLAIAVGIQTASAGSQPPVANQYIVFGIDNVKLMTDAPASYVLTVAKAGTGSGTVNADSGAIACGATCSGSYADASVVTLTAAADNGSTFAGWSGGCSGAAAAASVTMSSAKTCTATFDNAPAPPGPTPTPVTPPIPQVPVNVDTSGSGQGTVSLAAALANVPANTPITVQQTSGAPLPSWLTFDTATLSFNYNVPLPSDLPIQPVAADADMRAAKASRTVVPNRVYPLSVLVQKVPVLLTAGSAQYIVNMDFYAPRSPVAMTAVSYSEAGRSGNAVSGKPVLSWDAGQVLFETAATNLYPAFSNYTMVGRYHGLSGNRDLLSQTAIPGGGVANASNGPATAPAVSANGAYGAFAAAAAGVTLDPTSALRQVYRTSLVYPRVPLNEAATPVPAMVSVSATNAPANAAADKPALSQDGNFVTFESAATNLGMNPTATTQIFRKNMGDGSVSMVSANAAGVAGNGDSRNASISWDGRFAAFDSTATNLVPGVSGRQVYLKDLSTNAVFVISATAGNAGNQPSVAPKLDGRASSVVFASQGTNLGVGGNRYWQIWRFDTATGVLTLISATPSGSAGNQDSDQPTVSADGRYIAYRSAATDLQAGFAGNGFTQVWVRDVFRNATALVTQTDAGRPGGGNAYDPALSGDGASIAFGAQARDLVNGNPLPGQIHLAGNPLVLPGRTAHWYAPAGGNQAWTVERWGNQAYVANLAYDANGGVGTWVSGFCTFDGLACTGTLNQITGGAAAVKTSAAPAGSFAMTYAADGTSATMSFGSGSPYQVQLYPVAGPSTNSFAGLPQGGWWYEPANTAAATGVFLQFGTQTGTNGTINQTAHLSLLSYDANGHPVWYAAEGVLGRDLSLEGTLYRYAGGAPLGQATGGLSPSATPVGTVRVTFPANDHAMLRLPDGRTATLGRFRF